MGKYSTLDNDGWIMVICGLNRSYLWEAYCRWLSSSDFQLRGYSTRPVGPFVGSLPHHFCIERLACEFYLAVYVMVTKLPIQSCFVPVTSCGRARMPPHNWLQFLWVLHVLSMGFTYCLSHWDTVISFSIKSCASGRMEEQVGWGCCRWILSILCGSSIILVPILRRLSTRQAMPRWRSSMGIYVSPDPK